MRHRSFMLTLLVACMFQLPAQGIEFFHGTWEEAMEVAKQEGKPIFVDAYASWCGPCKSMAARVFPQPEVGEVFNANFINLKLDMEKPEAATFRADHPVRAYPTLFFLDAEGETIHTVVGGQQVKGLINQARTALKKVDNLPKYQERYAAGERDPAFVLKYVRALIRQGEPHLKVANEQLREQAGQLGNPDNLRLLVLAATEADSRIFDLMVDNKAGIVALISQEAYDKQVKLAFNNTLTKVLELEAPGLLENAVRKYKNIDADAASDYELNGELKLAAQGSDAKTFVKAAKQYYKKVAAGNAQELADLFQLLTGSRFVTNEKVKDLTETVGMEAAQEKDHYRDYYLLAKWLHDVDRNEAALSAAQKSKALVPEDQPNTHRLIDYLIKQINEA